jgi:hypothetical protein
VKLKKRLEKPEDVKNFQFFVLDSDIDGDGRLEWIDLSFQFFVLDSMLDP